MKWFPMLFALVLSLLAPLHATDTDAKTQAVINENLSTLYTKSVVRRKDATTLPSIGAPEKDRLSPGSAAADYETSLRTALYRGTYTYKLSDTLGFGASNDPGGRSFGFSYNAGDRVTVRTGYFRNRVTKDHAFMIRMEAPFPSDPLFIFR